MSTHGGLLAFHGKTSYGKVIDSRAAVEKNPFLPVVLSVTILGYVVTDKCANHSLPCENGFVCPRTCAESHQVPTTLWPEVRCTMFG